MFGFKYYKALPTRYVMKYKRGKLGKEGRGLSFFYFVKTANIVEIPLESRELPFIFKEYTADFQELSIQGQFIYQITDPSTIAGQLDFTIEDGVYKSTDSTKLPERLLNIIQEKIRGVISTMDLRQALQTGHKLGAAAMKELQDNEETEKLGVTIHSLRITLVRPNPETARALEAGIREQILQDADEAVYKRRNSAVEQERLIQENELNTQIAMEKKQQEIQEEKIQAEEQALRAKIRMDNSKMENQLGLENKNRELVKMQADSTKTNGEAEAYKVAELMNAYNKINPELVEAMKYSGMNHVQILADGFRELARNSDKIGQLNISPDIVQALMNAGDIVRKES